MATVRQFEDLLCWKKARLLTKEIYKEFKDLKDFGFKDQIQRAAVSIMSNIAEGFESGTKQEFLNYLYIAKGSAGEVRAQLYAAYDIGYLNIETFKYLNALALECSRLIASFIKGLKVSKFQGPQFKRAGREGDNWLKEWMEKEGKVFTGQGVMTKEEAERRGLEVIE